MEQDVELSAVIDGSVSEVESTPENSKPRPSRMVHFDEEETDCEPNRDTTLTRQRRLQRLKSNMSVQELANNELELKGALYFHICNPLKRWKVQRKIPGKLILNLVKTVLIMVQVGLFVNMQGSKRIVFLLSTKKLLENIFLQSYTNDNSLFTKEQVFKEIDHAIEAYYNFSKIGIGGFGHVIDDNGEILSIVGNIKEYRHVFLNPNTLSYEFDSTVKEYDILISSSANVSNDILSEDFLDSLIELKLCMKISSVHLVDRGAVECFILDVDIIFSNENHNGFIQYQLELDYDKVKCNGTQNDSAERIAFIAFGTIFDILVMALSALSIGLVIPTYIRGYKLGKAMGEFYKNHLKLTLSWKDRSSLFSKWLLFTIMSDLLLFVGSFIKILLQLDKLMDKIQDLVQFRGFLLTLILIQAITDTASARILLGSAVIMHSGTILRYASFFKQLNALTRTLNVAFPELIKFLLCTSILFFSFTLCGYIVFGPYSEKFSNISIALESLYSLTNGDDIYPSFRAFDVSTSTAVYIYSRVFIYIFVALFVYAVLNLFTTLIISSYEASQNIDRSLSNEVRRFVFSGPLTENGAALRDVTYVRKYVEPAVVLKKFYRQRKRSYVVDLD